MSKKLILFFYKTANLSPCFATKKTKPKDRLSISLFGQKGETSVNGSDIALEKEYEEYLLYLYELAAYKYGDCREIDSLVQETLIVLLVKQKQGIDIKHKKGFLAAVLKNKYNEWLRAKYKNSVISFEGYDVADDRFDLLEIEEETLRSEEYTAVRREIGRLIKIYREVTVRHYVHGQSVEKIASELGISVGTVKSRLSSAREQIKEGISKMEKYSEISYSPKTLSLAIWGSHGLSSEPFSLIRTEIEQNILILAYDSPVSIRGLSDTTGIPAAFIEPLVERLVQGELMGKTAGGLVYTRCFLVNYEDSFGDIPAQEALAQKHAKAVWDISAKQFAPIFEHSEFQSMSEKQRATLCLFGIDMALSQLVSECRVNKSAPVFPPERPNGGRWFAYGTVFENGAKRNIKYESSGPVTINVSYEADKSFCCRLQDKQSFFGSAHWAYQTFKYNCTLHTIARFYASLIPDCDIKPDDERIYELVPDFERLNIVKRDSDGGLLLDIPYLTEKTTQDLFYPAITRIQKAVAEVAKEDLENIGKTKKHRVPKHVDGHEHCADQWLLRAYPLAVLKAIAEANLMPYRAEIGKTPIIFLTYRRKGQ